MSAEESETLSGSTAASSDAGFDDDGGRPQEIDLVDEILGGLARASAEETGARPMDAGPALADADSKLSGTKTQAVTQPAAIEPIAVDASVEPIAVDASVEPIAVDATAALPDVEAPNQGVQGRGFHVPHPLSRTRKARAPKTESVRAATTSGRLLRFVLAFALTAIGGLLLLVAVAAGIRGMYSDRVVPGVRIGSVDVSGLTRDQVVARLKSSYAYMSQGEVTVTTATGTARISYQDAGRAPNVETMAYEAFHVGHTGDPIADTVAMFRSAIGGETVPLAVTLDPTAVATQVRLLVSSNLPPRDAKATVSSSSFSLQPSADGKGIDEVAISSAIVDHLGQPDQSPDFQAGGAFITLKPTVSDQVAQAAIDQAQKMLVNVDLSFVAPAPATASANPSASATPSATPSPSSSSSPAPAKLFTIPSDTVLSWISFGFDAQGKYVASVDEAKIQASIAAMNIKVGSAPVEPKVTFDPTTGHPAGVEGGVPGVGMDLGGTAHAVATYLEGLRTGAYRSPVSIVTSDVAPQINVESLANMVIIGSWTTTFYPDISNGNGANIRTPAKILSGQVVAPGQQFSFLGRVGPIDPAHGFTLGGVIEHGKSDHTGAMGGGICSASTTMFNAAAWAGLQMDERHNHAYYIDRYPMGLDATVFSNGYQTYDEKWTNDTPNPIVIRGTSTKGSRSTVTFQLWSLPLDRKVTFTPKYQANLSKATDSTVYTTKIPPGTKNRAEYPSDGFDTSRTRTVTDSTGKVIHTDTWKSHYITVDGILQIGVAPGPAPTAPGGPTPAPIHTPAATAAPRRRRRPTELED